MLGSFLFISVIVHDFDIESIIALPDEAYAPLIVDADAVLAFAAALQRFKPVGGRYAQVFQSPRIVQHPEFAAGDRLDVAGQALRDLAGPDLFGFPVVETPDHEPS